MSDGADPATPRPLSPSRVEVHGVQFVGTNVEMTWWVASERASPDEVEAGLDALLTAKLGLYALTRTGEEPDRVRFSVIASPMDRLFHAIGPKTALTVIKQASLTHELSETNLARQAQGLMRTYPAPTRAEGATGSVQTRSASGEDAATETGDVRDDGLVIQTWRAWDVGKLLGTFVRRPELLDHGRAEVAGHEVPRGAFPDAALPFLDAHAAERDGIRVALAPTLRDVLAG